MALRKNKPNKEQIWDTPSDREDYLKVVYEDYVDKIKRFIFWRVSHEQTAEELTHEVFVRFIQVSTKQGFDVEKLNVGAYLYKIARNLVTDHYQAQGRASFVELTETVKSLRSEQQLVQDQLDLELVTNKLNELKPLWRDIIIMHRIDGLSFKDIAHVCGKSVGAVRVIAHRATKELHKRLNDDQTTN